MGNYMTNKLEIMEVISSRIKNIFKYDEVSLWWIGRNNLLAVNTGLIKNDAKLAISYFIKKNIQNFVRKIYHLKIDFNLQNIFCDVVFYDGYLCRRPNYDLKTFKGIANENEFNYNIQNMLKEKNRNSFNILCYPFYDTNAYKDIFTKKINPNDTIPYEYFITKEVFREENKIRKHYLKLWENKLKNDRNFKRLFTVDNIDYWNEFGTLLKLYIKKFLSEGVRWYLTWNNILGIFKPKVFFTICEYGPEQYMGIAAAKKLGIKTVALQHGVIHPSHNGYYHLLENVSKTDEDFTNYVLPDITCVQGEYEKRILLKYGYPKEKVVVTGQPRYDLLYYADKIYDKKQIFKQLELDAHKKLIVWTTQTHGLSLEENKKNIAAIYSAVKTLKNVQLVIKLHPGEDQRAALYKKDESFNPIIKGKGMDTYALLYACDLMVTRHSTTAMEAVALNKPVIILNLSREPDPVEYVKEGVALGVYKKEDLKTAIEKLLKDDYELAKNRKKYIEKYLYKIDGKATERVVNLIEEMIEESLRRKNGK